MKLHNLKQLSVLLLTLLLCLGLSGAALAASGEAGAASGAMPNMAAGSGEAVYTVSDEGLVLDEDSAASVTEAPGAVTTAEAISGVCIDASDVAVSGVNFTGTGALAIGGEEELFDVTTHFTGENRAFNTVVRLTVPQGYDWGSDSSGGVGIGVRSAGRVTMDKVYALNTGVGRYTLSLSRGETVIRDCYFESVGCEAEHCDMPWFTAQLGNARNVIACGTLSAYIYNSTAASEGYGSWSTDTGGNPFVFYLYNGDCLNYYGGYGTYADTGLTVFVYGSRFDSAEYGAFCTNTGVLNLASSDDAKAASDETFLENLEGEELAENTPTEIVADRNAIVFHVVDTMHKASAVSGVKDSSVSTAWNTAPVLNAQNTTLSTVGATGEAPTGYPVLQQAWLNHLHGSAIVFRGACGDANLNNVKLESSSGVLIHSCLDLDESAVQILDDVATEDIHGACVNSVGNDWSGDILNEDYQRPLRLNFEDTTLTGAIVTTGLEEWNALWADFADVHYSLDPDTGLYVNDADPAETGSNFRVVDPSAIYGWLCAFDRYDAVRGTFLTMDAASVWNVTAPSQLVSLTLEPGAAIYGVVTVDGVETDVSAGGSWQGEIAVTPAGSVYGVRGEIDEAAASHEAVGLSSGEMALEGAVIVYTDGTAVQNSGSSEIVVRNSYIRGDSSASTEPLAGNPGNLLVAGSIRTTLALGQGQSFYINSTIISKNWAALSTDGAEPALAEGERELSLYAYGTDAVTTDGGYSAYSDLFCNLYVYGSRLRSPEIGIISGTYGRVTIGSIADGEANEALAAKLSDDDRALRSDKSLGSVVEGGRNAVMLHSVNLPPYWAYEGYSQAELPLYETEFTAADSVLRTDLSLDQNVAYEAQKQAYIDHSAGSVLLIKSTNVNMELTRCTLEADPAGTGAIVHTVYNNDTMFMNAVPDGQQYPGTHITLSDMTAEGDVVDEDYQRDLYLTLSGSALSGAVNYYDCAHWNEAAAAEGFSDYALDAAYDCVHGSYLSLENGSVWNVTAESTLLGLTIDDSSAVTGAVMTVDGAETALAPGSYQGVIVLTPTN